MPMKRKRVLWIDDEVEYLRSHIMFLETRGYAVTPVFSGDDGLYQLQKGEDRYDIVLLDEQMPGKDGLTVLVEIKELYPDLPVVMVTKSEEEELMEKAIGRNIDGYLTKPVNPSQVLLVCKNLLNSGEYVSKQAKTLFVKSYSDIQTSLNRSLGYKEWVKLYHSLIKREMSLSDIDDESIRQGHHGQFNDANKKFGDWLISVYPKWVEESVARPTMCHDILKKFIIPEISSGRPIAFLVLDSLRMDQYITIQRIIKRNFQVNNYFYYSLIPTAKEIALSSLLTGALPRDIKKEHESLWSVVEQGGTVWEELVKIGLEPSDIPHEKRTFYDFSAGAIDIDSIASSIVRDGCVPTIHADFLQLFAGFDSSAALGEMAANGTAFREMLESWFRGSRLYELLRRLSSEEVTVILTCSSGNILSTRGTEYYGQDQKIYSGRFRYGESVSCDERFGYHLTEPERFGLPVRSDSTLYISLKENYYFTEHASYQEYNRHYKNSFERGGVSMDEVILPLSVLKPKVLDLDLDF